MRAVPVCYSCYVCSKPTYIYSYRQPCRTRFHLAWLEYLKMAYILHLAFYILHLTSYILPLTSCILHLIFHSLQLTSTLYFLHLASYTLHLASYRRALADVAQQGYGATRILVRVLVYIRTWLISHLAFHRRALADFARQGYGVEFLAAL